MSGGVTALGYVGVRGPDLRAWETFATSVLGMQVAKEHGEDGVLRLRTDDYAYRVEVLQSDEPGLAYVGWECASEDDWKGVLSRLTDGGHSVVVASSDEARQQAVRGLAFVHDPADYSLHLFYGHTMSVDRFVPSGPVSGFVTGPLGLGHVVLRVPDLQHATQFYCGLLGFKVTDYWKSVLTFLRCNPRHHSLALAEGGGDNLIYHMMLQVQTIDDVGTAQAACDDLGILRTMTLGRHMNDETLSFYMMTPSGFEIELGCDTMMVDDSKWRVREFQDRSFWGHQPLVERSLKVKEREHHDA